MKQIIDKTVVVALVLAFVIIMGLAARAEQTAVDRPVIYWMPRDTYGNHFMAGSGFVPGKTRVWIQEAPVLHLMKEKERQRYEERLLKALSLPLPELPRQPLEKDSNGKPVPKGAWQPLADDWRIAVVSPWTTRPDALAFEHTTMWGSWGQKITRIYWAETPAGFSRPYLGGAVDPWFAFPNAIRPGQWTRVIGRSMDVYVRSNRMVAMKEISSGRVVRAEWGLMILTNNDAGENTFHTYVKVPDNAAPGRYELYLHNGSGGVYGWAEPVVITVLPEAEPVLSEVHELIIPDGQRIRSAAWMNEHLVEIADNGGGIALLPAGKYNLEKTVIVPPGVTLRGVSRDGVELLPTGGEPAILLQSNTALESLTVNQTSGLAPAVQVGRLDETVVNVRLKRCRLISKPGLANDPERYCGIVAASPTRNLTIRDCLLEGRYLVGIFARAEYAHLAYSQAGLQVEAGLENSIVEFNECRDVPCTYFVQLRDSDVRHNLFSWNKLVGLTPVDLPMGFVFDGSQAGINAAVVQTRATILMIDNEMSGSDSSGKWVVVINGPARGTVRRIVSSSGNELTLATPMAVMPKRGDQLYIGPLITQNLLAVNMDIRHSGGVEFLGACVDNTIFSHISEETRGAAFLGTGNPGKTAAPCYFNMAEKLDIYYGGSMGVGAIRAGEPTAATLAYGNVLYNVTVNDSRWVTPGLLGTASDDPNEQLRWGGIWFVDRAVLPKAQPSAVTANAVMQSRSSTSASGAGFHVGPGVAGTILKDVIGFGNPEGLRDLGRETTRK